jgi:hypothetical protein
LRKTKEANKNTTRDCYYRCHLFDPHSLKACQLPFCAVPSRRAGLYLYCLSSLS